MGAVDHFRVVLQDDPKHQIALMGMGQAFAMADNLDKALYYFKRGPLGGHERHTGRVIERFTYFERAAHWSNAAAFSVLAISGLVMAFGKFFLLPVTGHTLFGWITYALKTAHNLSLIHISEPTRPY